MDKKFKFAIDRGGTFTDIWVRCPDGRTRVTKLLSEDPAKYDDAPREGIRRILEEVRTALIIAHSTRPVSTVNVVIADNANFLLTTSTLTGPEVQAMGCDYVYLIDHGPFKNRILEYM